MIAEKVTEIMPVAGLRLKLVTTVSFSVLCSALHMAYAVVTQDYVSPYAGGSVCPKLRTVLCSARFRQPFAPECQFCRWKSALESLRLLRLLTCLPTFRGNVSTNVRVPLDCIVAPPTLKAAPNDRLWFLCAVTPTAVPQEGSGSNPP